MSNFEKRIISIQGKVRFFHFYIKSLTKIEPATVDVERIFSAPNLVLTKLRTRLSDAFIDKIILLNPSKANLR